MNRVIQTAKKPSKKYLKISINQFDCQSTWSLQDFQIIKQLGRGKFGHVYAAKQKNSDYVVALKKMSKKQLEINNFNKQVKRQIIIQSALKHDHVLRLFGYFWDDDFIYLILQYAPGGQLYKALKSVGRFNEKDVALIIRQVCQGLDYLHSKNIIHRDIKPQNLLISLGKIKIADFGWSIHSFYKRQTLCGTLDYLSPEMVKGVQHDSTVDVWGVGVLAYELAVGTPPFQTESYQQTYYRILHEQVQFPEYISYSLRKFIRNLLVKSPDKRITIKQALEDPFLLNLEHIQLSF